MKKSRQDEVLMDLGEAEDDITSETQERENYMEITDQRGGMQDMRCGNGACMEEICRIVLPGTRRSKE